MVIRGAGLWGSWEGGVRYGLFQRLRGRSGEVKGLMVGRGEEGSGGNEEVREGG